MSPIDNCSTAGITLLTWSLWWHRLGCGPLWKSIIHAEITNTKTQDESVCEAEAPNTNSSISKSHWCHLVGDLGTALLPGGRPGIRVGFLEGGIKAGLTGGRGGGGGRGGTGTDGGTGGKTGNTGGPVWFDGGTTGGTWRVKKYLKIKHFLSCNQVIIVIYTCNLLCVQDEIQDKRMLNPNWASETMELSA